MKILALTLILVFAPVLAIAQEDYGRIVNNQISQCPNAIYDNSTNGLSGYSCRIELPAGVLTIRTPIRPKTGVFIEGQGRGVTILQLGNQVNLSVFQVGTNPDETGPFTDADNYVAYVNIEHITIDGNAINQSRPCYGIHFAHAGRATIRDVRISNTKSHAIVADNGSLTAPMASGTKTGLFRFHDLDLVTAGHGFSEDRYRTYPMGIYLWGTIDSIITGVDFNDLSGTSPAAIRIRDCGDINVADNLLETTKDVTILLEGKQNQIRIHDNYIRGHGERLGNLSVRNLGTCAHCNIHDNN